MKFANRYFVVIVLYVLTSTFVCASETGWKPVNSWLDPITLQWKWAVESVPSEYSPALSWAITSIGQTGFTVNATGPYAYTQYLHIYQFKDYSTRFGIPLNATIQKISIKVTRIGGFCFNNEGMQDTHMYLIINSITGIDRGDGYTLPNAYTDFPTSPYEWATTWTSVIYGYDADDPSVGSPYWWGFSNILPSDLPTIGFKLSANGVYTGGQAGWGAAAKCYPDDGWLIAINVVYN